LRLNFGPFSNVPFAFSQAFHQSRMAQGQPLRDQASQRLTDHVRLARPDRVEPAGHVVGDVRLGVRTINSVTLSHVTGVKGQGSKLGSKVPLRTAECPVVSPQPTQEDKWISLATHFLIEERTTLDDDLGHDRNRWYRAVYSACVHHDSDGRHTPHELFALLHATRRKPPPGPRHFSWLPEELVYPCFS
jgi:hypothetical protein